jgi:hypothetical protein
MIMALIFAVASFLAMLLLGSQIARAILAPQQRAELLALAFPLGGGVLTWILFLVSWAGLPLNLSSVIVVYALALMAAVVIGARVSGNRSGEKRRSSGRPIAALSSADKLHKALLLFFTFLIGLAAYIAVARSYSTWDAAAIWASKGYGIALEGSVFAGAKWGAHGLGYPLNVPILISVFEWLGGDSLPGSKLIFPAFLASVSLGIYTFWIRQGVSMLLAGLGMLLVASVPSIFLHATIGYANLPMACYLVLGTLYGMEGFFGKRPQALPISGILLGLASWTRVEGVMYCLAILAALILIALISRQARPGIVLWLLPFALISGTWLLFYRTSGSSGGQAMGALRMAISSIGQGELNLVELRLILGYFRRYAFHIPTWGVLFPACALLLLSRWRSLRRRELPQAFAGILAIVGTGLVTFILFYVGSFISPDLFGWLVRSFPRAFFPTAILIAVVAILVAGTPRVRGDRLSSEA